MAQTRRNSSTAARKGIGLSAGCAEIANPGRPGHRPPAACLTARRSHDSAETSRRSSRSDHNEGAALGITIIKTLHLKNRGADLEDPHPSRKATRCTPPPGGGAPAPLGAARRPTPPFG